MFGSRIIRLQSVDSSNNYIAKAIDNGIYGEGTVILAHFQTEGRGQRGSLWQSVAGENLTFSFGIKVGYLSVHGHFLIAKAISLGICDYLRSVFGEAVAIKWPNDILIGGAKICGILIEMKGSMPKYAIVGIGLNVNQKHFSPGFKATSMANELGMDLPSNEVLDNVLKCLAFRISQMENHAADSIHSAYMQSLYGSDEWVLFEESERTFTGIISNVDDEGVLYTRSRQGRLYSYRAKEVAIRY